MIFYVYFDPAVIATAQAEGPYALQLLIATLRGFQQNCLIVDFKDDYRLEDAIREQVAMMPESFDRKLIKSLLSRKKKRNRFVCCLVPDDAGGRSDQELLMEQAADAMIDLALLAAEPVAGTVPKQMEVITLATYQHSKFEKERSRLAASGKRSTPGEMSATDFMDFHFRKALRFATKIELCDRALGRYYGDNYEYTLREFFRWLGQILFDPTRCEVDLHCEVRPGEKKDCAIESELQAGKRERLAAMTVRVHYYDGSGFGDSLPHERFICTEQVALSIDRGLDFLDKHSRCNRAVFVTYSDPAECQATLNHFAGKRYGDPRTI